MPGSKPPPRPDPVAVAARDLTDATRKVARAITADAAPGHDAAGGLISSLTEAVMGVTAGLHAIAGAISDLADAVRDGRAEG